MWLRMISVPSNTAATIWTPLTGVRANREMPDNCPAKVMTRHVIVGDTRTPQPMNNERGKAWTCSSRAQLPLVTQQAERR